MHHGLLLRVLSKIDVRVLLDLPVLAALMGLPELLLAVLAVLAAVRIVSLQRVDVDVDLDPLQLPDPVLMMMLLLILLLLLLLSALNLEALPQA